MKDLQAAIIGLGFVGRAHLDALRRLGIHILGLLESSVELGAAAAKTASIPHVYRSLDELLIDDQVDVVHICTPNYLHAFYAKSLLESGKHVICEKPLAMTSQEAASLVEIARVAGRVGAVCYNLRYYPLCWQMHEMVKSGSIGEPKLVHGSYLQDWLCLDTDWNWRLEPHLGGELRAVADIGTHWMDLASWVTSRKIISVCADMATILPIRYKPVDDQQTFTGKLASSHNLEKKSIITEDYASILLRFQENLHGVLTVSQVSYGRKNRLWIEIDGSEGSLSWNSEEPNLLWIGSRSQPNRVMIKDPSIMYESIRDYAGFPGGHAEGYPDTFVQLFKSFYSYIARGNYQESRTFPTFESGYEEVILGEKILESASSERWCQIL